MAATHDPVTGSHRPALADVFELGPGAGVLRAVDAQAADFAGSRLARVALGRVRRKQRELRAAPDAVGSAEIEPVALAVHRDHRALEGEPLHDVGDDLADGAVDRPRVSCARDLAPDEASAGRVELGLDDEAFVIAGDAAEHDHVDRAAQRRVLPALGGDPVDADLQPLDLALEVGDRHLAEHGGLEEVGRDGGLRLGGDVLEIRAGSVAHEPVHPDPDRPGSRRGEGALDTDLALEDDGRLPLGGEVAGRRQRDLRPAARRPVVRIGVVPPIVGLAQRPAVDAHRDAGHAGPDAVLVAAGGHGQDGPPGQRDLQPLSRLHGRALLPGRIAGLADRERDAFRGQRRVFVNELALGVRLAELLVIQLDGGVGDRRPALVHGHGEVAGHGEIRLEGIALDDLAVLAELYQERRLPGLDVMPRQLLAHEHFDLGAGVPRDRLGEHAGAVRHAELLAVDRDGGAGRRLSLHTGLDFELHLLTAAGRQKQGGRRGDPVPDSMPDHGPPTSWAVGCSLHRD